MKSSCTRDSLPFPSKRWRATFLSGVEPQGFWIWGYQVQLRAVVRYQTEKENE